MEKELWIIRHGETEYNKQGIVQGRGVNPSLNDVGEHQAYLFHEYYYAEKFDIIFTSTLQRSQQSVRRFIAKGIPWEARPELDEISWGVFEGQPASYNFKMNYRRMLQQWERGNLDAKSEGGESPNEVKERQRRFITELISRPERKILICMHGRAMRIFIPNLIDGNISAMEDYPHHNLTLYKVIFDGNQFAVSLFNNRDHLYVHDQD
jgi:probable phosphoglycerate mutase